MRNIWETQADVEAERLIDFKQDCDVKDITPPLHISMPLSDLTHDHQLVRREKDIQNARIRTENHGYMCPWSTKAVRYICSNSQQYIV